MNWYALRSMAQREFAAQLAMARRNVECFLPVEHIKRRKRKGQMRDMETIKRPLMRGYLFVRLPDETALIDLMYDMTRDTIGRRLIIGCVEVNRRPGLVSTADIATLRTFDNRILTPDAPRIFMVGEKVMIMDGPATGIPGKVLRSRKGKIRLDTPMGIVEIGAEAVA